jgi:FixJ family two-component response regulator
MTSKGAIVFVVDDDPSVRKGLSRVLQSNGYTVESFSGAAEFKARGYDSQLPACLILDVQMPGLSGIELQDELLDSGAGMPIIFVSAHGDIPTSVRAMKRGAVDFLQKPLDADELLKSVAQAIEKATFEQQVRIYRESVHRRLNTLTPREREVMSLIVTGRLNKQVASELGTVEKTIKVHRGRVMEKMQVKSLAELVQLVERIQLPTLHGAFGAPEFLQAGMMAPPTEHYRTERY